MMLVLPSGFVTCSSSLTRTCTAASQAPVVNTTTTDPGGHRQLSEVGQHRHHPLLELELGIAPPSTGTIGLLVHVVVHSDNLSSQNHHHEWGVSKRGAKPPLLTSRR